MGNWLDKMLGSPEGQQELASQQLQTQLQAIALQQETEKAEAALKYDPARIKEQTKQIITIVVAVVLLSIAGYLIIKYVKF